MSIAMSNRSDSAYELMFDDLIRETFGLSDATTTPIESYHQSTWDVGGKYILKSYSKNSEISRALQYSNLLTPYGIPVAAIVPTKDGQLTSPDGAYCLMTKLPGKHADLYSEPNLSLEMGRELAKLHIALAEIESKINAYDSNLLDDWKNRIVPSLSDVSESIIKSVDTDFCKVFPKLPHQLIHRDVHLHNVLFDDGRLTGWLDFDIGQRNVRIFDIAYLLSGLLIGNINKPERIEQWHTIYKNLLQGYCEVNLLPGDEVDALPVLMIVIEFLFVWFWGGQDNTEQRNVARELAEWLHNKYMGGNPSES